MLVIGLDVETTGLDSKVDEVIEIGAVLWDTESQSPKKFLGKLIQPAFCNINSKITELTGITPKDVENFGEKPELVWKEVASLMTQCTYAIAHNAPFDRAFIERSMTEAGVFIPHISWIDTAVDLPKKAYGKSRSLTYLAADHGFLNPFSHRALFDVFTMLRVVSHYPIDVLIERSHSAMLLVKAHVSYHERELAKQKGFYWNGESKMWEKRVKLTDLEEESGEWDFQFSSEYIMEQ